MPNGAAPLSTNTLTTVGRERISTAPKLNGLSGKYTSWNYPYGYKAGTDGNRTAVIDEEAAAVVKRIFAIRVEGKSFRAIARKLTGEGIPNPATYFTKLDGGKWDRPCSPYWCPSTVARILSDPTYIGSTVQRKTTSVSYKNRKVVNLPPSEYIVRENAHEGIVSRELWEKVQGINKSVSRGRADKSDKLHALSGLLVCADCGKKLKLKTGKGKSGRSLNCGFLCRTYVDLGKKYCSSHAVTEREIEGIVLDDLKSMLGSDIVDESVARELFYRSREKRNARSSDEIRLKALKKRVAELDKLVQSAFEDRVLKGVPESVFANLCEKYEKERAIAAEETAKIEKRLAAEDVGEDAEDYVKKLKSYAQCEDLTREMCLQLINFITVGEKRMITKEKYIFITV